MGATLNRAIVLGAAARFQRVETHARIHRRAALAELARRWLVAHGPATDRDLAAWAGLPLRDARAGLGAIAGELRDAGDVVVDLADATRAAEPIAPRLLGAFDPYLLGWRERSFA